MSSPVYYVYYYYYGTIISIMFIENYYVNYFISKLLYQLLCFKCVMFIIAIIRIEALCILR